MILKRNYMFEIFLFEDCSIKIVVSDSFNLGIDEIPNVVEPVKDFGGSSHKQQSAQYPVKLETLSNPSLD